MDRLWPRGLTKEVARIDVWLKDVAPSNELRKWIHNYPSQWEGFVVRYRAELATNPKAAASIRQLRDAASLGAVTLIFSTKVNDWNNATVLRDVLQEGN